MLHPICNTSSTRPSRHRGRMLETFQQLRRCACSFEGSGQTHSPPLPRAVQQYKPNFVPQGTSSRHRDPSPTPRQCAHEDHDGQVTTKTREMKEKEQGTDNNPTRPLRDDEQGKSREPGAQTAAQSKRERVTSHHLHCTLDLGTC